MNLVTEAKMTSPNLNSQPSHPKTNLQHLSIIYFSPSHSQPIHDPTILLQNLHPTPTKLPVFPAADSNLFSPCGGQNRV